MTTPSEGWIARLPAGVRPYLEPAPLAALFLGVSSGFTFAMLGATLTTRLAQHGLGRTEVVAFALTILAYNLKFLWAPVVDNVRLPIIGRFGQRRSWLWLIGVLVMAAVAGLGFADPTGPLVLVAAAAIALGVAGATYDIIIDAYRIELLMRLDENWQALNSRGVDLVVTTGIVGTDPREHSVTRIPGDVRFSLDIRSQSLETLEAFYQLVLVEAAAIEKGRGVKFDFGERLLTEPGLIDRDWAAKLRTLCEALGLPYIDIPSGAGHDAAIFANEGVPAAMIFVRNDRGSHNPDEQMELGDFMMGVELLYQAVTTPAEALR
jgi:hypothetical protein